MSDFQKALADAVREHTGVVFSDEELTLIEATVNRKKEST
jgi:hypothetical protein